MNNSGINSGSGSGINSNSMKYKNFHIKRSKKGNKNVYTDRKTKKRLNNKQLLERIESMKLPPAYETVFISKNKGDKVQAIGIDSKGRDQYFYHPSVIEERKENKFNDLIYFIKYLPRIRADMFREINGCNCENQFTKKQIISMVLFLLDRCNFRVGSQKYMNLYDTFGATTIQGKHIICKNNNKVLVNFIGKKSVENTSEITHPKMCALMKYMKTLGNNSDFVFKYSGVNNNNNNNNNNNVINEVEVNNYLKLYHPSISAKMFRTYSANNELIKGLRNMKLEESVNKNKKNVLELLRKIAGKHHHTVSVARSSYLHDGIVNCFLETPQRWSGLCKKYKNNDDILTYIIKNN